MVLELCREFDLEEKDVKGHYELDPKKTCPNLDMDQFRQDIADQLHPPEPQSWLQVILDFFRYTHSKDT